MSVHQLPRSPGFPTRQAVYASQEGLARILGHNKSKVQSPYDHCTQRREAASERRPDSRVVCSLLARPDLGQNCVKSSVAVLAAKEAGCISRAVNTS